MLSVTKSLPLTTHRPGTLLGRFVEVLMVWQERAHERYQLAGLNDHAMKDIGLSRADVRKESSKPFWRA